MTMKFAGLFLLSLLACSCARTHFVRAAPPFEPKGAGPSLEARQAYFEAQKVHVVASNHGVIGGQDYNGIELIRYYDDSKHGDASALAVKAQAEILRADDWAFYGPAYGSIIGTLLGALGAYLATATYDFQALDKAGKGALLGLAYGTGAGLTVGWTGFGLRRYEALTLQREAAGEFNHTARNLLKIEPAPPGKGLGAQIQWEY
jgi:hypothetical protein